VRDIEVESIYRSTGGDAAIAAFFLNQKERGCHRVSQVRKYTLRSVFGEFQAKQQFSQRSCRKLQCLE